MKNPLQPPTIRWKWNKVKGKPPEEGILWKMRHRVYEKGRGKFQQSFKVWANNFLSSQRILHPYKATEDAIRNDVEKIDSHHFLTKNRRGDEIELWLENFDPAQTKAFWEVMVELLDRMDSSMKKSNPPYIPEIDQEKGLSDHVLTITILKVVRDKKLTRLQIEEVLKNQGIHSAGNLYAYLKELQKRGYIHASAVMKADANKAVAVFSITPSGLDYLSMLQQKIKTLINPVQELPASAKLRKDFAECEKEKEELEEKVKELEEKIDEWESDYSRVDSDLDEANEALSEIDDDLGSLIFEMEKLRDGLKWYKDRTIDKPELIRLLDEWLKDLTDIKNLTP